MFVGAYGSGDCWILLDREEGAMMSAHLACFALFPPRPSYTRKCDLFTSFKWLLGNIMSNEKSICLAPHTQTLQQQKKKHSFILLRHWQGHLLAELLRKENPKAKQKGKKWKDSCPVSFFLTLVFTFTSLISPMINFIFSWKSLNLALEKSSEVCSEPWGDFQSEQWSIRGCLRFIMMINRLVKQFSLECKKRNMQIMRLDGSYFAVSSV